MGRPRSDIEPRILHAARRRFLAEGVDGASLRTIASDAKTNVGMIFYYFPTKDDLFLAVVEEVYAQLVDDLSAALEGGATTRESLGAAFARLGEATPDEVEVIRLVLREALLVPSSERFTRIVARFRQGHLAVLLRTIMRGVNEGELDGTVPLPLLMVTTFAMGGLPQLVRRVAGHEPPFSLLPEPTELAKTSVELLLGGIAAPAAAAVAAVAAKRKKRSGKKKR
jgi:AcrR family transcriptional regulator